MKNLIILPFTILSIVTVNAQMSVSGSFNLTTPGLYFTLGPDYTWNHHRIGTGINFNQSYSPDYSTDMTWNLKPHNFSESFGVNLNYNYVFYPRNSEIEPYIFFDLNYQFCGSRNPTVMTEGPIVIYATQDPFNTISETIGAGFTTDIYANLYFNLKAGIGLYQQNTFSNFDLALDGTTYKIAVGMGYRFGDWQSE